MSKNYDFDANCYFPVKCVCGWTGSSGECHQHEDSFICPACLSTEPDSIKEELAADELARKNAEIQRLKGYGSLEIEKLIAARDERDELRAQLVEREPYVQHLETCDTWLFGSCDCGLDELLASHKEQSDD